MDLMAQSQDLNVQRGSGAKRRLERLE